MPAMIDVTLLAWNTTQKPWSGEVKEAAAREDGATTAAPEEDEDRRSLRGNRGLGETEEEGNAANATTFKNTTEAGPETRTNVCKSNRS